MRRSTFLAAWVLSTAAASLAFIQPASFDLLIVNGRVMTGSGDPAVSADIGVRAGRIAGLGRLSGARASRTIDAAGRVVAPGFIDAHSHAAESITHPDLRQARPLVAQGVTTIVVNPDGGGPVDLVRQRAELEAAGTGVNVALLIGHGAIRTAVLGDSPAAPDDRQLARMQEFVRNATRDGAFGLSSGLFYLPGAYAKTEEVIALTRVAGEGGVYSSHIRDEADYNVGVVSAVEEVIRIAEEGRVTGIVSHMKALGPASWGLSTVMIDRIDKARGRGVQVFADQYPYEASSTSLGAALLAQAGKDDAPDRLTVVRENLRRRGGPASIVIASFEPDRSLEGKSLAEIAAARGKSPEEVVLDIRARGDASIVSFNMSEEDIERIMRQSWTMTSSDGALTLPGAGRPHPRGNGAFARKLARYVRDRRTISLDFAIRSMTSLPATVFGMKDRGLLRKGASADVVIFDPAAMQDRATYTDPHQLATGMDFVLVNGQVVVDQGRLTGALPGRVLRR
ncbi:MAG TPA: D-aminoacylase [Vicinamibacterales bacterium]|jgi:N-acyl-D-amino-acid deacylase|nr:D-aminoacylase [Vicinamibacterales bacterium]